MNLQGVLSFPSIPMNSELLKKENQPKEKKGIFAVHSFQEPKTSILSKSKKKTQTIKTPASPKKEQTPSNCFGNGLSYSESNEMICDTTIDDSHSEKSSEKEASTNTLSTNFFAEGHESNVSKSKDKPQPERKNSFLSVNVSVPNFLNDRTYNATTNENLCQYSEICKKYFFLEDRDLYLVTRERINSACDMSKFDEDLFFSFDN